MTEFERIKLMHHQEHLLKQHEKKLVSKWQKARKLVKAAAGTLNEKEEAELIKALNYAVKALLKMQVEEENPPLKKIALDAMNGEPVWVVSYNHDGKWGIVDTSDQSVAFFVDDKIEKEYWFDGRYIFKYKKEIFDHSALLAKFNIQDEEDDR